MNWMKLFIYGLTAMIIIPLWLLLLAAVFQACWNVSVPHIFSLPSITYWQSFCLMMVANMLFHTSVNTEVKNK